MTDNHDSRTPQPYLKKHVAAIHCANNLSLLQRKISNALLYHAYPKLLTAETHQISILHLCQLIGYQGHNHQKIKTAVRALVSTVIEWNLVGECGSEDWTACSMLAGARLKVGQCYYSYYVGLRELLHSPKVYARIDLPVQMRFHSNYGLALYENCVRYRDLNQTKDFHIDVFRRLMGIPEDRYLIFRDFKRRVLDQAVEEVNAHTDFQIEPRVTRKGRKVVSIQFLLTSREQDKRIKEKPFSITEQEASNTMIREFGIAPAEASALLRTYSAEAIVEKARNVQQSNAFRAGLIKNISGYLIDAIKKDYQPPTSSQAARAAVERKAWDNAERQQSIQRRQDRLARDFLNYTNQEMVEQFGTISTETQQMLFAQFVKELPSLFAQKFRQQGLDNHTLRTLFKIFMIKNYPQYLSLTSYDEYLTLVSTKSTMVVENGR